MSIQILDVDKDGAVSEQELQSAPATLLKLDLDGDGKVNQDEIRKRSRGGQRGNRERRSR